MDYEIEVLSSDDGQLFRVVYDGRLLGVYESSHDAREHIALAREDDAERARFEAELEADRIADEAETVGQYARRITGLA
jgi:hypothetical protein